MNEPFKSSRICLFLETWRRGIARENRNSDQRKSTVMKSDEQRKNALWKTQSIGEHAHRTDPMQTYAVNVAAFDRYLDGSRVSNGRGTKY